MEVINKSAQLTILRVYWEWVSALTFIKISYFRKDFPPDIHDAFDWKKINFG